MKRQFANRSIFAVLLLSPLCPLSCSFACRLSESPPATSAATAAVTKALQVLTTLAVPTEEERPQTNDNWSSGHLVILWLLLPVPSVVLSCRLTLPPLPRGICDSGPSAQLAEPVLIIPIFSVNERKRSKGQRLPAAMKWSALSLAPPLWDVSPSSVGCVRRPATLLFKFPNFNWLHNFCLSTWNASK